MGRGRFVDEDPLTLALAPPAGETPEQRQVREAAEAEAKRRSDEIDEQIKREKDGEKRKKKPVKLLLLGQSESGKTATLKNFQLTYARREWSEERASWRAVIWLNLVRNVNEILDHLNQEMSESSYLPSVAEPQSDASSDELHVVRKSRTLPPLQYNERHRLLKLRLTPLAQVQADLEVKLGAAATEEYRTPVTKAAPFDPPSKRRALPEFSINSSNGWKSAFDKFRTLRAPRSGSEAGVPRPAKDSEDEIGEVLSGCREDIKAIWDDEIVREMLIRRKVRLEDRPGFFLNDIDRVAVPSYQPTDDDVIRARLRTLGVQEYRFVFDHGRTAGQEWRLYDVGGTRSSRAAWYPYFDDADAIIFLAYLAEDNRVNRLEDSYLLWRSVCSCKALARTQLILFLNKCDLLQAKLQRGIRIRDSVPSFGDRKNDLATATKYFQQHFKEMLRQHSPVQRTFFVYLTSVIDTRSTAITLGAVEESILREHLRCADLM
ncbi:G-alpha-domain-containing protein [Pluteus cervinus]|uniref:G-alpha-domain-containing protein n=1 Tax=Pluteus cervinus TaxID=181527 RepID=A0ACD3B3Z7_9AGAR|nr:G-alpha-domain-containing protein [Pluteus cervinus]